MLSVETVDLYYGASHALRRVSLTAAKGEVTCILGRNGVGKTSLLRAIFGLQPIRAGRISWENRVLNDLSPHERARAGLALVPRGREIFPRLSVLENLETGFASLARELRRIPDEIFTLFPGLRDMLHRRGGDLSGGQQQQLAIARALVTRPRLLILDEPTEGIQPSIIKDIERVIRGLAESGNMAILLVEQYFDFARDLAAAYLVMQRGEVVASGRREDMDEAAVRSYLTVCAGNAEVGSRSARASASSHLDCRGEDIAAAAHRLDHRRPLRIVLELPAKPPDLDVDCSVERSCFSIAGEIEQPVAGQHLVGVVYEGGEQI